MDNGSQSRFQKLTAGFALWLGIVGLRVILLLMGRTMAQSGPVGAVVISAGSDIQTP